jgi:hypothetical protein
MANPAILYPMFALVAWTVAVLLLIPFARIKAALRREVRVDDFKYGESAAVPPHVSLPNRNYMNLLELPMLFYVGCLLLHITGNPSGTAIGAAWTYVVLRMIHSGIHLSFNHVILRSAVFAASNFALVTLWILAALQVGGHAAACALGR